MTQFKTVIKTDAWAHLGEDGIFTVLCDLSQSMFFNRHRHSAKSLPRGHKKLRRRHCVRLIGAINHQPFEPTDMKDTFYSGNIIICNVHPEIHRSINQTQIYLEIRDIWSSMWGSFFFSIKVMHWSCCCLYTWLKANLPPITWTYMGSNMVWKRKLELIFLLHIC